MPFETGDIVIFQGTPGHVGMVYDGGALGRTTVIHAQRVGGFHIDPLASLLAPADRVYRGPWQAYPHLNRAAKQAALRDVAQDIRIYAQYGVYRAIRLFFGSSAFGSDARARLAKYKARREGGFAQNKFVTTVTCSEAVILCYQLSFAERDEPFFIKLDAAHTMPGTLRGWLSTRWARVHGPA